MKKTNLFIYCLLLIANCTFAQIGSGISNTISSKIPHEDAKALNVRGVGQNVDRIGFAKVISNNVDTDFLQIIGSIGAGQTVNQTGGNLVITSGTTAKSETIIRSNASWEGGIRMRAKVTLSQRIVQQFFYVELVDVIGDGLAYTISSSTAVTVTFPAGHGFTSENVGQSMYLGAFAGTGTFMGGRYPIASVSGNNITFTVAGFLAGTGTVSAFGWNYYQLQYQGTASTQINFDTQRKGWANGSTTTNMQSSASGHLATITGNDLNASFSDQLLSSVAGTIQQVTRATRNENVPDDVPLRLQVRIMNAAFAPASSTTLTIGMLSVSNYSATDVAIQDVRQISPQSALPVEIMRTQIVTQVSGTTSANQGSAGSTNWLFEPRTGTTNASTSSNLNSAATTNATLLKATAGMVYSISINNSTGAAKYLRLYNLTTAPTVGTSTPVMVITVPSGSSKEIVYPHGLKFVTGISYAITNAAGYLDATAIAAGDVQVLINWN